MKVKFICTGFGAFPGVCTNPTQLIVQQLASSSSSSSSSSSPFSIASSMLLDVSIQGVESSFPDIMEKAKEIKEDETIVFLHFGVNSGADCFALENCAWNEKSFSRPDTKGNTPAKEKIDETLPLESCLKTSLNLDLICKLMNEKFKTVISQDPGKYICNFTFYRSLQHTTPPRECECKCECECQRQRLHSLFCHVPCLEVADIALQKQFVDELLKNIAISLS